MLPFYCLKYKYKSNTFIHTSTVYIGCGSSGPGFEAHRYMYHLNIIYPLFHPLQSKDNCEALINANLSANKIMESGRFLTYHT